MDRATCNPSKVRRTRLSYTRRLQAAPISYKLRSKLENNFDKVCISLSLLEDRRDSTSIGSQDHRDPKVADIRNSVKALDGTVSLIGANVARQGGIKSSLHWQSAHAGCVKHTTKYSACHKLHRWRRVIHGHHCRVNRLPPMKSVRKFSVKFPSGNYRKELRIDTAPQRQSTKTYLNTDSCQNTFT